MVRCMAVDGSVRVVEAQCADVTRDGHCHCGLSNCWEGVTVLDEWVNMATIVIARESCEIWLK